MDNKIINGDCLEEMKQIPDHSVDLILTDLPYGTIACEWDKIIPAKDMWREYNRVIKPDSVILLFACQPFTTYLISSNIHQYKYSWYWIKNTGTNFFHCKRMPIRHVEEICVFGNNSKKYYPQKTTGHIPTNSGIGQNTGNVYSGKSKVNYQGGDTTRYPKNYLHFNTVNNYKRSHPTEKPIDLLEYLIQTYTLENELVLDSCAGSGSTGIACLNTKRHYILIEKDPGYHDAIQQRISLHKRGVF